MSAVRPLVLKNGEIQEFQDTDTLIGAGSGGGSGTGVSFDSFEVINGELILTNASAIATSSEIIDGELVVIFS